MTGVIDYGAGNLRSVTNALDHLDVAWTLVDRPEALARCARAILPGVGHFGAAVRRLNEAHLTGEIRRFASSGRPLLGVCLGAQLLLDHSAEAPDCEGLGIISGQVVRLTTTTIPHMGWNRVEVAEDVEIFDPSSVGAYFYFAHSYVCAPQHPSNVAATVECDGATLCVAVRHGRTFGVQFHPEKSAAAGLELLGRFVAC